MADQEWVIPGRPPKALAELSLNSFTLADSLTAPIPVLAVGSFMMGYNSVTGFWDRSLSYNLIDADTGAGTYLVPGVNLLSRASGGPVEIGTVTNPLNVRHYLTATYTEPITQSDFQPVYSFPVSYNTNGGANNFYFNRSALQNYAGAGMGSSTVPLGIQAVAMSAQYDDTSTDTPPENAFHHPRITLNRALHNNLRDASGNEILPATDVTLLASASRTTTQTSADLLNYGGCSALNVVLDMTTVGTGSVTISIDGKDTASGKYYNILTGAAVTTNSTNRYRIGPTITAVANSIAQDYLPRTFRIVVTANNANAATYSVGYSLTK
jgi:hypothetical protein